MPRSRLRIWRNVRWMQSYAWSWVTDRNIFRRPLSPFLSLALVFSFFSWDMRARGCVYRCRLCRWIFTEGVRSFCFCPMTITFWSLLLSFCLCLSLLPRGVDRENRGFVIYRKQKMERKISSGARAHSQLRKYVESLKRVHYDFFFLEYRV